MKEVFKSIFTIIFYLASFADYGLGLVHSFKKHGVADGLIGAIAFPWALYRGAEYWWHDDFDGVNWEKRLSSDIKTCVYFVGQPVSNQYQLNEDIEKFTEKINSYPVGKKQYLEYGTKNFISYINSINNDFKRAFSDYKTKGVFQITQSEATQKIEQDLSKYQLSEEIKSINQGIGQLNKKLQNELPALNSDSDTSKIKELENSILTQFEYQNKEHKRIFKSLFNSEFTLSRH